MKKKVTIAKRSASSKGTANIENKNLLKTVAKAKDDARFTESDHFTESTSGDTKFTESDHFSESIKEKLSKLRWNIQKNFRKLP